MGNQSARALHNVEIPGRCRGQVVSDAGELLGAGSGGLHEAERTAGGGAPVGDVAAGAAAANAARPVAAVGHAEGGGARLDAATAAAGVPDPTEVVGGDAVGGGAGPAEVLLGAVNAGGGAHPPVAIQVAGGTDVGAAGDGGRSGGGRRG